MLGKGLESLIPQKGNNAPGGAPVAGDVSPQSPAAKAIAPSADSQEVPRDDMSEGARPIPHAAPASEYGSSPPVASIPADQAPASLPPLSASAAAKAFQKPAQGKSSEPQQAQSVFHIEVGKITSNPNQPRRNFDEAGLRDLAHSIREFGFLQPLVVSRVEKETADGVGVEYQLIAGERRLMAAKMLGLPTVPAIVRNVDLEREKLELAILENIQRENLSPIESARAFQRLQEEFHMTQREIAAKLGKSREVVANAMRLLDLPEAMRAAVEKGELGESNARLLLTISDPSAQQHFFEDIVKNRMTTREAKERMGRVPGTPGARGRGRPPKSEEEPLTPELQAAQDALSSDLGTPVTIHKGANTGRITITFYSEEELESILRRLGADH